MSRVLGINVLLIGVTLAVYLPVRQYEYVRYDDPIYVFDNEQVLAGLTADSVRWSLTAQVNGEWHPLTMLSHMLDVQMFGRDAGKHHLVNVGLHIVNVLLVFASLRALTGRRASSAVVALIFALHPLNVETVAWISQRKSLLSAMFWLLTMWAYAGYARRSSVPRYLGLLIFLALGLMCKPIVVTLPCALLLLDIWPLRRLGKMTFKQLIVEKIPMFALCAIVSIITLAVQGHGLRASSTYPLMLRFQNALIGYFRYLGKLLWPTDLAVFYPFPQPIADDMWPWSLLCFAALTLLVITLIAWFMKWRGRFRYFGVGWCWYLGVMLPMVGLVVQQGDQAMADRFMYLPMLGLLVMVVWSVADLTRHIPPLRTAAKLGVVVVTVAAAAMTSIQLSYWTNSLRLFHRAIEVTEDNLPAHASLGHLYFRLGRYDLAYHHYGQAEMIHPKYLKVVMGSGLALFEMGKYDLAADQLRKALALAKKDDVEPHYRLALALTLSDRPAAAEHLFNIVLQQRPQDIEAHTYMGLALMNLGRLDAAMKHIEFVLSNRPNHPIARQILADLKALSGS